jgi:glycogen operon protein
MRSPHVLQLIADSLRYWVTEMHVDGFRFDLASILGRDPVTFNRHAAFFQVLHQDPILSKVKLIAEPWDLGDGGYQLGMFPTGWYEWNGKYRDTVRDFWRGESSAKGDFATRLASSQDFFPRRRRALASINFVTCHDGFSLRDLVSYNQKHNEANGEGNRDGDDHNRSWNCGAEGATGDRKILDLREQQVRNFLTTLLLSQGVPMIRAGDEIGHSQQGNNNAYCQDNELNWLAWQAQTVARQRIQFLRRLIRFRRELVNRRLFIRYIWDLSLPPADVKWIRQDGLTMAEEDWHNGRCQVGVLLSRQSHRNPEQEVDDLAVFLAFNAYHEPLVIRLPQLSVPRRWKRMLDTRLPRSRPRHCQDGQYIVAARSSCIFVPTSKTWF